MVAEGIGPIIETSSQVEHENSSKGILQVADELEKLAAQPIRFESNK